MPARVVACSSSPNGHNRSGLCAVDRAAPADGEDCIGAEHAGRFCGGLHISIFWVRLHLIVDLHFDPLTFQIGKELCVEGKRRDAAVADQEYAGVPLPGELLRHPPDRSPFIANCGW